MREDSLSDLAKKLNVSKSTLSKVARHCSGVDSDTREQVLDSIPKNSLPFEKKDAPIYTILPDIPQYFRNELRQGFADGEKQCLVPVKHNIYTRCSDESTILHYPDEAEKMDLRVLVIAAYITPEIRRRLETLNKRCMVLLVSEYAELTNAFYVGADAYRDGYNIGKAYLSTYADRRLIYFRMRDNENVRLRTVGFLDAVGESAPGLLANAVAMDIDNTIFRDLKMLASRLAHLLAAYDDASSRFCLYSPTGMVQLPLSLKKANLHERTVCICHDCFTKTADIPDGFHLCCNQNVYAQGFESAKTATTFVTTLTYPAEKRLLLPSGIR